MGGIRKFKHRKKFGSDRQQPSTGERGNYVELIRENAEFDKFYKAQKIVPETEWSSFLEALRRELPASFRISDCSEKESAALLNIVEGSFFKDLINPEDPEEQQKKPLCLPWYPKRLGWQVPLSRKDIRRSETYFKLHNFLMSETATGSISRQEVVSMIPPLVLDVKPHHKVLDMCAAPGSKTAQLIEMMHSEDILPSGVVVANDVDNSRCYMLVHQAKRLNSPCTVVTNHDASVMPNIIVDNPDCSPGIMKYDRILCDVPCTGDGTLRKNADIWKKWNCINGNNLHGVQSRIVKRAGEMLAVGGQMVYSTCSLNPIENEAVIHRFLSESEGAMELLDVSKTLPGLAYTPGISSWILSNKEVDKIFTNPEDVPEELNSQISPKMFPPKPEDVEKYHLDRCIRIMPHKQDTGGFFVAVLKKLALLPWEASKQSEPDAGDPNEVSKPKSNGPPPKRRRIMGYREDPFVFFSDEEPVWPIIRDFYKLSPDLPINCLLTRCLVGKKKNLYFVSPTVRDIINKNQTNIKIINAGVKTFARCDNKNVDACFRLAQEGLPSISRYVGDSRKLTVTKEDLIKLLSCEDLRHPPETTSLDKSTQEKLEHITQGSCVLEYRGEDGLNLNLVGWRGTCSLRAYVPVPDCVHYIRLLGGDPSMFEKNKFKKECENKPVEVGESDIKEPSEKNNCSEKDLAVMEEGPVEDVVKDSLSSNVT